MNSNNCDTCGKRTFTNPDRETVYEEEEVEFEAPMPVQVGIDKKTKKELFEMQMVKQKKTIKKPKMTYQRVMDRNTGKIVKHPIPEVIYKQPRTAYFRLKIGGDIIQRDFCEECIKGGNRKAREIFETAEKLWSLLEEVK
jgi:hypothetical protein